MAYYTFTKSQYKAMPSAQSSSLGIRKASDGTYYTTKSAATKHGGVKVSSKPGSSSSSGGSSTVSLSRAKVGDLRKVSSSGKKYYYDQDDIDKRDNTGKYAPVKTSAPTISSEHQAALDNAEKQGASLGWSAQQIQWAKDAVNSQYTGSTPPDPAEEPPSGNEVVEEETTTTTPDEEEETTTTEDWDDSDFKNSPEYKALSAEDQEAVLAVFGAIAGNDATQAQRLTDAFKAAGKINDPYFAQQLRLAVDAIERGYVSIDKEVDTLQQNLSASGFGSSSRRAKKEGFLNEATGDMRESTNRSFAYQQEQGELALGRSQRDTAKEVARLKEITKEGKLDFLRQAESKVGSKGLPNLGVGAPDPLGGIQGSLAEERLTNTINSASSFVF